LIGIAFTNSFLTLRLFYEERMSNFLPTNIAKMILPYLPSYAFSMAFGLISCYSASEFELDRMFWN
jgi:hypothetical protein